MAENTVCHIEWDVTDLERAQTFFGAVFEWTFRSFGGDMVVFGSGDKHLGGFMKVDSVHAGFSPSVWIEVGSIEATLAKVASVGGSVVKGKGDVPGVGWSAVFTDPDGNRVGIVQFSGS
ncbi:MAG: VOC family protein [Armatimonadetes bacterium]|nr:VOC family protein [Armatimonadota bacterium]